jgi:hydrogenase maturation protease
VQGGTFVSLLEPPPEYQEAAGRCENVKTWPVLAGEPGDRHTLLSSPIILYDYPQVSPQSPGNLFDGTEIDELLTLSILTLTDEEKQEMRESDARAREILERTESLTPEQLMQLHGAIRSLQPLSGEEP